MKLLFDIEADNLYHLVSKVHCISAIDVESKVKYYFRPDEIQKGLELLKQATHLYGHNIFSYDLPVLLKLLGWSPDESTILIDTEVLSRFCYPDLENDDFRSSRRDVQVLAGSHALKAWGIRLQCLKGDYHQQEDAWETFSEEMLEYCMQDCIVNNTLLTHLKCMAPSLPALSLEMEFAQNVAEMCLAGFPFDMEKARKLEQTLQEHIDSLEKKLQNIFPPTITPMKKPACYFLNILNGETLEFKTKGLADSHRKKLKLKPSEAEIKPGPIAVKTELFNPGSRQQIADRLKGKYGWDSPTTEKGNPRIDEEVLKGTTFEETPFLIDYLTLKKRLSQLSTGTQSWIKHCQPDGKIYHRNITIGCSTMRNSHSSPNLGQVPSVSVSKDTGELVYGIEGYFGTDCRELFTVEEGYRQVGTDLSGIEARMLAHYLQPFDKGKYIHTVLEGDIHQLNTDAINSYGFPIKRNDSKSIFYGFCYGAGDAKLGIQIVSVCQEARNQFVSEYNRIYTQTPNREKAEFLGYRNIGASVRRALEQGIDGLGQLIEMVKTRAARGYLSPLDGRKLPIRSEHSALNVLLQGSAAIIMKRWVVLMMNEVKQRKLDARMLAIIHDEVQAQVAPHHVDEFSFIAIQTIKKAGEYYGLSIPLDGEVKVGNNWAMCH